MGVPEREMAAHGDGQEKLLGIPVDCSLFRLWVTCRGFCDMPRLLLSCCIMVFVWSIGDVVLFVVLFAGTSLFCSSGLGSKQEAVNLTLCVVCGSLVHRVTDAIMPLDLQNWSLRWELAHQWGGQQLPIRLFPSPIVVQMGVLVVFLEFRIAVFRCRK